MAQKSLIQLENCDVLLDSQTVLQDVSWQLQSGENWAFSGGNGAGKSTILKLIRGDIWPHFAKGARTYRFNGIETCSPLRARENIALVSSAQHEKYRRQEWKLVGRDVISSGFFQTELLHQKLTAQQIEQAEKLSQELKIEELLLRDINTLSHGELRKLLIAHALVMRPQVLVLDEFCNGLDAVSRAQILRFVDELPVRGVQLLMATHRRDEIVSSITHIAKLENGRIVSQGLKDDILRLPKQCKARIEYSIPAANQQNYQTLVEIENTDVFRDENCVLHNVNWRWKANQHWRVRGENGSGKSTFLKLLAGDLWPSFGGTIKRFDNFKFDDIWQMKQRIGIVSPELQERYDDNVSAFDVVASGFVSGIGVVPDLTEAQRKTVGQTLQLCGIAHLRDKLITQMSSGQARKTLLARALVNAPDILLLDEPFDSLDEDSVLDFKTLLAQAAQNGAHVLLVSHHDEDKLPFLTHEMFFENGRVVAQNAI